MAIIESDVDDSTVQVELVKTAALFHCLADPMRLMILEHLRTGEHKVKELTEHLGLAQSTVSAHLACLRDGNLVQARTMGRASLYSLSSPQSLDALLRCAQPLLSSRPLEHQWHDEHQSSRG